MGGIAIVVPEWLRIVVGIGVRCTRNDENWIYVVVGERLTRIQNSSKLSQKIQWFEPPSSRPVPLWMNHIHNVKMTIFQVHHWEFCAVISNRSVVDYDITRTKMIARHTWWVSERTDTRKRTGHIFVSFHDSSDKGFIPLWEIRIHGIIVDHIGRK